MTTTLKDAPHNPFATAETFDEAESRVSSPAYGEQSKESSTEWQSNDQTMMDEQYLGDVPYRRVPVYRQVRWLPSGSLASYAGHQDAAFVRKTTRTLVAGCPHGGPIATLTLPVTETTIQNANVRILTNAGQLLANFQVPHGVVAMGFTSRAVLCLVTRDATCCTYYLQGQTVMEPFQIFTTPTEVKSASIFSDGVVVLGVTDTTAVVELLDEHDDPEYAASAHVVTSRVVSSPSCLVSSAHYALVGTWPAVALLHAVAVLPRAWTASQRPEVYCATTDGNVLVQHHDGSYTSLDTRLSAPIVAMNFAPNGRFVACLTANSTLTVINASFDTKILDFETPSSGQGGSPQDLQWCGTDSIVLYWRNVGVLVVGPYGDWLRFPYDDHDVYVLPEVDCCRLVTDSSVEILQRVPPATASLLRVGSIEPSAMLLDASDAFQAGSPASDEAARELLDAGLPEAIEACTEAATREFDMAVQKRLLRAASFGMNFLFKGQDGLMGGKLSGESIEGDTMPSPLTAQFVEAARKLRILNALRNPDTGMILTADQYDAITPTGVVARLIAVNRPSLAVSISEYLHLPRSIQLFARASKTAVMVKNDKDRTDSELAEAAVKIIEGDDTDFKSAGASSIHRGAYATVAVAATEAGRPGVANLLLMLETSVSDKIPALVASGSFNDAIAVATSARDHDFIFAILMEYEKECMASSGGDLAKAQTSFLTTVISKFTTEAFYTLQRYLETTPEAKSLTGLLVRSQRFVDAGNSVAHRAMGETDATEKKGMLKEASRIFGLGRDTGVQKQCTDEYVKLINDQATLRTKYGSYDVAPESTSLAATVTAMIKFAAVNEREQHRIFSDVDKLGASYRISDKRLWHMKIKALSESGQWSSLRSLAESKSKSPTGYKPFVKAVIAGKQPESEVLRYIKMIPVPEEKYDLLCEASLWKEALEVAAKLKDERRVLNVKTLCNSAEIQLMADEVLGRMT